MRKYKIFVDMEKEERYLSDMAENGYIFKKRTFFGGYYFEKEAGQKLNYRIDYRTFNNKEAFQGYVNFLEDGGWKLVYGKYDSGNQYFLPIDESAQTELFSDNVSRADRYKRYLRAATISILLSIIFLFLFSSVAMSVEPAPELLSKTINFVQYGLLTILLIVSAVEVVWAIKARKLYMDSFRKDS